MAKKEWSEEERKAFGEKMKAARARKDEPAEKTEEVVNNDDIGDLVKRVKELEAALRQRTEAPAPQVTSRGIVGTFNKYIVDPKNYPSPVERLKREPKLQRFAFPIRYELGYTVGRTNYQSIDGVNTAEPKFTLELNSVVFDEDTGEPTVGRHKLRTGVFHEDPEAAIIVARENGLVVDENNQKLFLDEMRYLRFRDWLIDLFYPKPAQTKKNKREVVIDNTLVEYWEISSEDSQAIPFNELKSKV